MAAALQPLQAPTPTAMTLRTLGVPPGVRQERPVATCSTASPVAAAPSTLAAMATLAGMAPMLSATPTAQVPVSSAAPLPVLVAPALSSTALVPALVPAPSLAPTTTAALAAALLPSLGPAAAAAVTLASSATGAKASPTYTAAVVSTMSKKMDEVRAVPGAQELAAQIFADVAAGRGALECTVTRLVRLLDKPPAWWMNR